MRKSLIMVGLVLLAVLARMSFFTVDATEFVYVTQLGQHVATYDGADNENGAGLHWRWPWPIQSLQRLDRRLQSFDIQNVELMTRDLDPKRIGKTLVADVFASWRIASAEEVDHFVRRIGTETQAQHILDNRIKSQVRSATAQRRLEDLISIEPGHAEAKMRDLRQALLNELRPKVRTEYGIELVELRLRRFNHPDQVRGDIFVRIRSEREEMMEKIKSKGAARARNIQSEAEEKKRGILAQAQFEKVTLEGQADAEAAKVRNEAHSQDPDFYVFLKKMDKLHSILADNKNKAVLLLSTHRSIFDLLFQPPQPTGRPAAGIGKGPEAVTPPTPRTVDKQPAKKGGS
jgi:membrane protease subunit HflC